GASIRISILRPVLIELCLNSMLVIPVRFMPGYFAHAPMLVPPSPGVPVTDGRSGGHVQSVYAAPSIVIGWGGVGCSGSGSTVPPPRGSPLKLTTTLLSFQTSPAFGLKRYVPIAHSYPTST